MLKLWYQPFCFHIQQNPKNHISTKFNGSFFGRFHDVHPSSWGTDVQIFPMEDPDTTDRRLGLLVLWARGVMGQRVGGEGNQLAVNDEVVTVPFDVRLCSVYTRLFFLNNSTLSKPSMGTSKCFLVAISMGMYDYVNLSAKICIICGFSQDQRRGKARWSWRFVSRTRWHGEICLLEGLTNHHGDNLIWLPGDI